MNVYILSSGRADKQVTWTSLPDTLKSRTKLVVPYKELADYNRDYPTISTPPELPNGIGHARQWILDRHPHAKVAMLDDDLVFAKRRIDNPTKFFPAADYDVIHLFDRIERALDDYAHVGVGAREGGNRNINSVIHTTRMLRILCYKPEILKACNVRFDQIPVMEDFHVTLSLLRQGYDNVVLNHIVHNQGGSNSKGGCSQYRTKDLQEQAANILQSKHPDFVKVVKKQTKTAWGGQERTDVIVQWKKAYGSH